MANCPHKTAPCVLCSILYCPRMNEPLCNQCCAALLDPSQHLADSCLRFREIPSVMQIKDWLDIKTSAFRFMSIYIYTHTHAFNIWPLKIFIKYFHSVTLTNAFLNAFLLNRPSLLFHESLSLSYGHLYPCPNVLLYKYWAAHNPNRTKTDDSLLKWMKEGIKYWHKGEKINWYWKVHLY